LNPELQAGTLFAVVTLTGVGLVVTSPFTGSESFYSQEVHKGCQPGNIQKNGMCTVATSGQNADVFSAEDLDAVAAENTTLGGTPGYLARPDDNESHPSVVLVHEWWGLNSNIRHMADVLAGQGYSVFAVDLYDGEVARNSSEAARLSGQVRNNSEVAVQDMGDAVEALREKPYSDGQVASLGWCFGGGQSLQLSLSDADLNATAIYYGTLATDADTLRRIDGPVHGVFGSEDRVVSLESVREFNSTLGQLGVEKDIHVYEGAGHAFANPSGDSFRRNATRDAWNQTLQFLDEEMKQ
jgi:carboxymethylenebutenolidase